jgi:uncharacterized membrane protein YccC
MARWRPQSLTRLLIGPHIVNGASVAVGVLAVAIVSSLILGFQAGQPVTLGAIAASIADTPAPWREKARTIGLGFTMAVIVTTAAQLSLPWPLATVLVIGATAFVGGMLTGLGRWAVALGMQVIIPLVFVLGFPRDSRPMAMEIEVLFAIGGAIYLAYAVVATILTDTSARRLVAGESIREFSLYLRTVASIFDPKVDLAAAYGAAIRGQAALAEQLQLARPLLLHQATRAAASLRLSATIGILLDAFDALIAAQCDVAKVRDTPQAEALLSRARSALRIASLDLSRLAIEVLTPGAPRLSGDHKLATEALQREAIRLAGEPGVNPPEKAALAATTRRLRVELGHIGRLERVLSDENEAAGSMTGIDLAAFLPKRNYSLLSLRSHLTLASPVFRFSLRLSLAMMAGSLIALSLSDAGHGNWILLTIAVVMRAGYGLTKKRRDDRIIGTMVGCIMAVGAVGYLPPVALVAVQGLGVGLAHGFARLNYRIASTGASIMALVSLHLAQPWLPAPVLARLADTLIGAALAHLFNYVWPYWEFAQAPQIASRLEGRLQAFADVALKLNAAEQDYRLARKNMIEALAALSDSAGRMSIEPIATRKGLDEMAALLMATHGLVSQLSAARLDARTGVAPPPNEATRRWLKATLIADADKAPLREPPPPGPLTAAAVAVMAAARRYSDVAAAEEGL